MSVRVGSCRDRRGYLAVRVSLKKPNTYCYSYRFVSGFVSCHAVSCHPCRALPPSVASLVTAWCEKQFGTNRDDLQDNPVYSGSNRYESTRNILGPQRRPAYKVPRIWEVSLRILGRQNLQSGP